MNAGSISNRSVTPPPGEVSEVKLNGDKDNSPGTKALRRLVAKIDSSSRQPSRSNYSSGVRVIKRESTENATVSTGFCVVKKDKAGKPLNRNFLNRRLAADAQRICLLPKNNTQKKGIDCFAEWGFSE